MAPSVSTSSAHAIPLRALNLTLDRQGNVPLYVQIDQQIRQQIESGQLPPGSMLPTTREVTAHLNVAYKTVHQAFASLAREGYISRVPSKGSLVLKPPMKGVVGIYCEFDIFSVDGPPVCRYAVASLERWLDRQRRRYRLYVASRSKDSFNAAIKDLMRDIESKHIAGLMMIGAGTMAGPALELAKQHRMPVVALSAGPNDRDIPLTCNQDSHDFVMRAIEYLARHGRSRIGLVVNEASKLALPDQRGIRATIAASRFAGHCAAFVAGACTTIDGFRAAQQLDLSRLDGLIVTDEFMAVGVEQYLLQQNVRVPQDLAVAAQWSAISGIHFVLPFVRYEVDCEEWVSEGLDLLLRAVAGERTDHPNRTIRFRRIDDLTSEPYE